MSSMTGGIRALGLPQNLIYVGVAGAQSTNNAGWTGIGAIIFDPTLSYSGTLYTKTIYFNSVLETTSVLAECDIRLYNLDDAEAVINTTLTSISVTPERKLSAALTISDDAGNIKTSIKTYEVQILRNGGLITDYVTCKLAQLEFRFA